MPDIIQLLPDHVANQIAAGEVVQRPASVVKELLENAIDAGASNIQLIIKDAGKTRIQVIDNGKGMSTTDARLCFERHATSKIRTAEDLFALHTKGFRGEALASIAAIAHVTLKTKRAEDDLGTAIIIAGSHVESQTVVATPTGSSIAVKNLFFNIPARRNFLKSHTVELRHCVDEFQRVALAHPGIAFTLYNNGSKIFNLPVSNLRQRIVNIFGNKTNETLIPVEETTEIVKLSGFVGKPEFAKKTRGNQYFLVNHRFIKNNYLHHAVTSAFEGLLKSGTHPSYFLNLELPPERIDINIHPTKTEIKFDDEHTLYAILRSAIKHSLGQFNIAPILDFERDPSLDAPYNQNNTVVTPPQIEVNPEFNPFRESATRERSQTPTTSSDTAPATTHTWESTGLEIESKGTQNKTTMPPMNFESHVSDVSLFDSTETTTAHTTTYQLHNKYIISAIKSGVLVINQHRAHQRILYEDFLQSITLKEPVSQQLLFPLKLHFSTDEMVVIKTLQQDLESAGFLFSIDESHIKITGLPMHVLETEVAMILNKLIGDAQQEIPDTTFSRVDFLAKSMAKSLAIKNGQVLQKEEQEHLVNKLFACKDARVSPTNGVTFVTLGIDELDNKFK